MDQNIGQLKESIEKIEVELCNVLREDDPNCYPPLSFNRIKDYYEWLKECEEYNLTIHNKLYKNK